MDDKEFIVGKIERRRKEKLEREELLSFLLDYCPERLAKFWGAIRANGTKDISDIVGEHPSLGALGLNEEDLSSLYNGLDKYSEEKGIKLGDNSEDNNILRMDGFIYHRISNRMYGLRNFTVELCEMPVESAKAEFCNQYATGKYILIAGKMKLPEIRVGKRGTILKKLKDVCERFSRGEDMDEIVKNTGLPLGAVSGCLTNAGIIERRYKRYIIR